MVSKNTSNPTYCSNDDDAAGVGQDNYTDYKEDVDRVKSMYLKNSNS